MRLAIEMIIPFPIEIHTLRHLHDTCLACHEDMNGIALKPDPMNTFLASKRFENKDVYAPVQEQDIESAQTHVAHTIPPRSPCHSFLNLNGSSLAPSSVHPSHLVCSESAGSDHALHQLPTLPSPAFSCSRR